MIKSENAARNKAPLDSVRLKLSPNKQKVLETVTKVGASAWLTTVPVNAHGFYLDKKSFWDALRLRYDIPLERLPSNCVCGNSFNIEHALACHKGGFISIRHNEIRDLTADLLSQICKDVQVEPVLTPVTGELLPTGTITEDEGRTDISARGFWVRGSKAFLDLRVCNPIAKRYSTQSLSAAHKRNENEKKKSYNQRVQQIEHGTFTPLVFSSFGGMAHECNAFYKRWERRIAGKRGQEFAVIMNWVRTKLSFSLLRSTCYAYVVLGATEQRMDELLTSISLWLPHNVASINDNRVFNYFGFLVCLLVCCRLL